jgi:hypothetical protein
MNVDELNISFLDFIKQSFKGKKITVHVYEDEEMDETDYLLSDPVTKKRLLEAIENVKQNRDIKEYTIEDINSYLNDDGK